MKKIIEADLISMAHKILQIKDKSDVNILLSETEKLYQKLILLKFYEDNKFRLEPTLTEDVLFDSAEKSNTVQEANEPKTLNQQDFMSVAIVNELLEDSNKDEVLDFEEEANDDHVNEFVVENQHVNIVDPIENTESNSDIMENENEVFAEETSSKMQQITLDIDPVFSVAHDQLFTTGSMDSKVETATETKVQIEQLTESEDVVEPKEANEKELPFTQIPINKTINDAFNNTIIVGLNDRIAFEKHLFDGSLEDFNRTLSQLNTMDDYQDAKNFINELIKPDHNHWQGKEEYEKRFMALVEKRFL